MSKHEIVIDNKEKMTITEVTSIESLAEDEIRAAIPDGYLVVKGSDLSIESLDLEAGTAVITGEIDAMSYLGEEKESFVKKLFK